MKTFRFVFFLSVTLALTIVLNSKIAQIPPLGKFMSPFQGFWQNAETEKLSMSQNLSVEGLSAPVSVYYDEIMIPHIYAENDTDLHFVQGYLTARDRLWQMDFYSRMVFGRIAEVVGPRALAYDRLNRRLGLKKMTRQLYKIVQKDAALKAIILAYTEGVNAYIDGLSYADYPLEFKLLNYTPEPWTPQKTCMAYALLCNTLSRQESDLENTNALSLLGRELFDLLYPEQLGNLDPVVPREKTWDFEPIPVTKPDMAYPLISTPETIDKPDPLNGSNNFAVMGRKTKSGHVLLANEPDLTLALPSIWHASHLHSPTKNVMGVTVPGTPVILIGFNDSIAWGLTNSPRDQVDWYSVKFRDEERNEYWYNDQWFKTEKVIEEINVRGETTFYDTIIHVHHGPVVYDRHFRGDSQRRNYAMKWVAHTPGSTFSAMNRINQSTNYRDFQNAMRLFEGPPQNIVFASTKGNIAVWLPGKFPIKWKEQGKYLMDGSDPRHEWKTYIPYEHLMYHKNPEQGYLSSANQHPADSLYPYYVYDHNFEYFRNRRINDRLRMMLNMDHKDMMRLQNDNFSYMAFESLPMMLDSLDTAQFTSREWTHFKTLSSWDYFTHPDLEAPTLYQLWWDMLYTTLWDELDTVSVPVMKPNEFTTIYLLKKNPNLPFTDILDTEVQERTADLINITFKNAMDSLDRWAGQNENDYRWFQFKNTRISHLLSIRPFSRDQIRIGGYSHIVNAAAPTHGPSWRMVVELSPEGTKAWGVYPGSQTGNPGSHRYAHMIDKWAAGDYHELLFGQDIRSSPKVLFHQQIHPR